MSTTQKQQRQVKSKQTRGTTISESGESTVSEVATVPSTSTSTSGLASTSASASASASNEPNKNAHALRDSVVHILTSRFSNKLTEADARDVEVGIFNWTVKTAEERSIPKTWKNFMFHGMYTFKARSVLANLDPESSVGNPRLLDRIREREFFPHDVAFMKPHNVYPERWKKVLDEKMQKDEYIHNEKPASMTDQFKCGKCHKRECIYQELQLRSCDEPVSIFITCLNCGNRWRIG